MIHSPAAMVVVLAKAPVAGLAKTRMCPPCTPHAAAKLAEASLFDTADVVVAWGGRRLLSLDRCGISFGLERWPTIDQCQGGLGERLDHTFRTAFSMADAPARMFLVGMDTPQLTVEHLARGLAALDDADVVLGPAADGGYWGIGIKQYVHGLFDGVPMSSAKTFEAQSARAEALGKRVGVLEVLQDMDTFDDAVEVGRSVPDSRVGRLVASDAWWCRVD